MHLQIRRFNHLSLGVETQPLIALYVYPQYRVILPEPLPNALSVPIFNLRET